MSTPEMFSNARQEISGIPVQDLADQFGTPTYAYDLNVIQQRIAELSRFDVIR